MLVKTNAIVLKTTKYQEKSLIVKCFTLTDGLKTYFVPTAFSSKKSNQKMAYFQPMTILEIEANHKNKGTLEYFKEIKTAIPYTTIPTNIYKSTMVLFLSEMLCNCIQEEEKNEDLFLFLTTSLEWLDSHDRFANFHLLFILQLTKFFGFYPDNENSHLDFFDLLQGKFVPSLSEHAISLQNTNLFKRLLSLPLSNTESIFSKEERYLILEIIFQYFTLHINGFKKPISVAIIKQIFD
jgi:DNA repair protein RecO (recombination protein O)